MRSFLPAAQRRTQGGRVAMLARPCKERWLFAVVVVDDLPVNITGPAVGVAAIATCQPLLERLVLLL